MTIIATATSALMNTLTPTSSIRLINYAYDLAGNRTNGGKTYNANQITGFTYDFAGNLTNDGTASTYDALNRMRVRGTTTYTYTGDGTLVSQATSGVTTRYTQDFAAPLSQMLQIKVGSAAITDYLYGAEWSSQRPCSTVTLAGFHDNSPASVTP